MNTESETTPPAGVDEADFSRHMRSVEGRTAKRTDGMDWEQVLATIQTLPPETPEQRAEMERRAADRDRAERIGRFKRICPPEFAQRIDRSLIPNASAFDAVSQWSGTFPGPLAFGKTDTAKTRAAWSALGRLNVEHGKSFAWFPVKRLATEFARYEAKDAADEFWRFYRGFNILFVDDLDKINWQFESEMAVLFQFFDWVYRDQRPMICTTNKPREWWADKMGEAFARRLFSDCHTAVFFDLKKV
jgi:hypothetical protein